MGREDLENSDPFSAKELGEIAADLTEYASMIRAVADAMRDEHAGPRKFRYRPGLMKAMPVIGQFATGCKDSWRDRHTEKPEKEPTKKSPKKKP